MDGRQFEEELYAPRPGRSDGGGRRHGARDDLGGGIEAGADTEADWAGDHESFAALMEAEKKAFKNSMKESSGRGFADGSHGTDLSTLPLPKQEWRGTPDSDINGNDDAILGSFKGMSVKKESSGNQSLAYFNEKRPQPRNSEGRYPLTGHMNQGSSSSQGMTSTQSRRRCPFGMTSKDIDFVLRAHSRQLEMLRPFVDDFYLHEFNRKRNIPDDYLLNPQPEMEREPWMDAQRRPQHSNVNSMSLEKSLGTLQSWTPKAPRKTVDVTPMKSGTLLFTVMDDRVAVRAVLECGYDILADIDDCKRRVPPLPTDHHLVLVETEKLFNLFAISVDPDVDEAKKGREEKFFAQMCGLTKGKNLVAKALPLFQPAHQALLVATIAKHLGFLCSRDLFSKLEWQEAEPFWKAIRETINSIQDLSHLVWILWSFLEGHQQDTEGVVVAISNEEGGSIMYSILSRSFALRNSPETDPGDKDEVNKVFKRLFDIAVAQLANIFGIAENLSHTWEIIAMLDALAEGQDQNRLRSKVQSLLKTGGAPPPVRGR